MNTPIPAISMKREDYKAIKHMNRASLTAYLSRIYMRGYEAGVEAGADIKAVASAASDASETK